jgi:hypothetical protein
MTELLFINIQRLGLMLSLAPHFLARPVDIFADSLCTTCAKPLDKLFKKKIAPKLRIRPNEAAPGA